MCWLCVCLEQILQGKLRRVERQLQQRDIRIIELQARCRRSEKGSKPHQPRTAVPPPQNPPPQQQQQQLEKQEEEKQEEKHDSDSDKDL